LIVFNLVGNRRNANATVPRCWYTLGAEPADARDADREVRFLVLGELLDLPRRHDLLGSDFSSSGLSACWSSPTSSPFTRTVAGRPTLSSSRSRCAAPSPIAALK